MDSKLKHSSIALTKKLIKMLLVVFGFITNCFAQSVAKLDTVINLHNIKPQYVFDKNRLLHTHISKGNLFVANFEKNKLNISTYLVDKQLELSNTATIKTKTKIKNNDIYDFKFDYSLDRGVFLKSDYIYLFSLNKKKIIQKKANTNFKYVFLNSENIYCARYYNHHPNDQKNGFVIYKYDHCFNLQDSLAMNLPFMEYTIYTPKKLITFNKEHFIVPLFDKFHFLIIDKHLKDIDTFGLDKNEWVSPPEELSDAVSKNMDNLNSYFPLLDKENYYRISRIEWVEFVDSYKFVVRWFRKDTAKKYSTTFMDIFSLVNGKVETLKENIEDTPIPVKKTLPVKEGHFLLNSSHNKTIYFPDGIIQVRLTAETHITGETTYLEYYYKKEELEKKYPLILSLWLFKYD